MTINSYSPPLRYVGNGVATSFPLTMPFDFNSEIKVWQVNNTIPTAPLELLMTYIPPLDAGALVTVLAPILLPGQYTILGGNPGNAVVISPALSASYSLVIKREVDYTQNTDMQMSGPYLPERIEDSLDKLTKITQQLREKVDRAPKLSDGHAVGFDPTLPAYMPPSSVILVNPTATGFIEGPTAIQIINAEAFAGDAGDAAATAVAAAAAAAASAATAGIAASSTTAVATAALASEVAAGVSATNSAASAVSSATSATNSASAATSATGSATAASGSATTATTQAGNASTSATAAGTSATNSANSATASAGSATASANSATAAAGSATAAAGSATAAATTATSIGLTTKGDILSRTSSAYGRLGVGADGAVLVADSSQSLGVKWGAAAGGGSKNYVTYKDFENNATTGWSLFNTTLSSSIPNGAISAGAVSVTTFATTATNPLEKLYSLQTASSGTWSATHGFISDALPIDREDRSRILNFKASFEVTAGSANINASGTSANTYHVYLYDVANSAWVQPSGVYSFNAFTGQVSGSFQAAANATAFRLAILCVNASAGAVTINWDDFSLSPGTVVNATVITDWQGYTPVVYTGGPSISVAEARWRRVADSIQVQTRITLTNPSGNTNSAGLSLPPGAAIDLTKVTSQRRVGGGVKQGGSVSFSVLATTSNPGFVFFGGALSSMDWNTFAPNGELISYEFTVPVAGWGSNLLIGADGGDGRVCVASATTAASTAVANGVTTQFPLVTVTDNPNGAIVGNTFICPSAGRYRWSLVGGTDSSTNTGYVNLIARRGGVQVGTQGTGQSSTTASTYPTVIAESNCNAGDVLDFTISYGQGSNRNISGTAIFEKIQGPASIAAGETISSSYSSATGQAITTGFTTLIMPTKAWDSHGWYNASTGEWTLPTSGEYEFNGFFRQAAIASTIGNSTAVGLFVDGTLYRYIGVARRHTANALSLEFHAHGRVKGFANQKVSLRIVSDAAGTLDTVAGFNWVEGKLVGNY